MPFEVLEGILHAEEIVPRHSESTAGFMLQHDVVVTAGPQALLAPDSLGGGIAGDGGRPPDDGAAVVRLTLPQVAVDRKGPEARGAVGNHEVKPRGRPGPGS